MLMPTPGMSRLFSATVIKYGRSAFPTIKKFPVTLRIVYPHDDVISTRFQSFDDISELLQPKHFLVDPSGNAIYYRQVTKIDPNIVYRIVGPGLLAWEKGLARDQVWDKVFEKKASLAVKRVLEKEDPGVTELPRVVVDDQGKDASEWEGIFQMSDGCIVFLEAKYRMTMAHVDKQANRMSKTLRAMGKNSRAKLFLAGYYWDDDESCISFTRSKGYGILKPNGKDLSVDTMALVIAERQL